MSEGEQFGAEPAQPKKKMGGGAKLLLGCGIAAGILLVLCCGGATIFYRWAQQSFSDDPVVVRQVSDAIGTFDVPETMQPLVSMDVKIPFQDGQIRIAVYEIGEQQGMFTLAQFPPAMSGQDREGMLDQIKQNLQQKGRQQENIVADQTDEVELTIRDKPAKFLLVHGKGEDSGDEAWQVTGVFEGQDGPAFLMLMVHADAMSKDEIIGLLKSIK